MNTTHGKLKSSATRPRLGLALYLPSFPAARHCSSGLEGIVTVANVHCTERSQVSTSEATQFRDYLELVYLVTALVPSETACLANSPGSRSLTAVCISREVIVDLGQHMIITILIAVCLPLVVVGELACLCSNPLEEIVDEGVHDAHGL